MHSSRKVAIGVMGSASGDIIKDPSNIEKCRALGRAIGGSDCIMFTGACPGLPHEAVLGSKEAGGLVVGVSPAMCLHEHATYYESPHEEYDILIFTGSGLMGREVAAVRSCDIVITVGGRSGTLGEFSIAYDESKLIGALDGTGGITDQIEHIVDIVRKDTGAEVIIDEDPNRLVGRCLERHYERIAAGIISKGPMRERERPKGSSPA